MVQTATALAVSLAICKSGHYLTKYFRIQGGILPAVTAIVVALATVFPKQFAYLAPSGEAMAMILMQVMTPLFSLKTDRTDVGGITCPPYELILVYLCEN